MEINFNFTNQIQSQILKPHKRVKQSEKHTELFTLVNVHNVYVEWTDFKHI